MKSFIGHIKSGEIAIPEIQRPFVWKASQVRDLIDSLYRGYPAGYLIISQSPNMKLKDGTLSEGKKIMIDGQQRVTALMTAIAGKEILDKDFKKKRIIISFNPLANEDNEEEIFKVQDNAIRKDPRWIADIAEVFSTSFDPWTFVTEYTTKNPGIEPRTVNNAVGRLLGIRNRQLGVIVLEKDLTIDEVTEIFVRILTRFALRFIDIRGGFFDISGNSALSPESVSCNTGLVFNRRHRYNATRLSRRDDRAIPRSPIKNIRSGCAAYCFSTSVL